MQLFKTLDDAKLIDLIVGGAVGVIPTDTVYGLVAAAADEQAVQKLYGLKNRQKKPGTVIAANIDQLVSLGIPRRYLKAVEQYWPGAVSVIVPTEMKLGHLHLGKNSLACRIPEDHKLNGLLAKTGPLLTTSANRPSQPVADTVEAARHYFGDNIDFYVDGGDLNNHQPSTIIRIVDDAVEVVRQGAVNIDEASGSIID